MTLLSILKRRKAAYIGITIALIIAILLAAFDSRLKINVAKQVKNELTNNLENAKTKLNAFVSSHIQITNMLYNTPPIQGLSRAINNQGVDPLDNTSLMLWENRLATIFEATMHSYDEIQQIRFINATGQEWVRVEKTPRGVQIIPSVKLQDKSSRDYVKNTLLLTERTVFVSMVELNREYGVVQYPYQPTIRISMAAYNKNNEVFGMLILNLDANDMFTQLITEKSTDLSLFMTDYYDVPIFAKQEWLQYWKDTNDGKTITSEFSISPWIDNKGLNLSYPEEDANWRAVNGFVRLPGNNEQHGIKIYTYASQQYILDLIKQSRSNTYPIIVGLSLLFLGVIFVLMRSLKNAEQLADAKQEFAGIINGATSGIITLDLQTRIKTVNKAASTMFSGLNSNMHNIDAKNVTSLPHSFINAACQKIPNGEILARQEMVITEQSGDAITIELNVSPVTNAKQECTGITLVAENITARKETERQIKQANEHLEKEVEERTAELNEQKEKAEKASEVKSSFISTISHEMRTPLNGILGMLHLLRREVLTEQQTQYVQMSESSCKTLSTLINDVLDLSKIEAGKLDFEHEFFNPISVAEHTANSIAVKALEKDIEFIVNVGQIQFDALKGDANRIKQVIFNLLSNAIKFTEHGGVYFTVSTNVISDTQVMLECEIRDSGIGIANENQEKLFEVFSQADNSISGQFGGTGLGLSICKEIIELMHGEIEFSSESGVGSIFKFSVPFKLEEASERKQSDLLKHLSFNLDGIESNEEKQQITQYINNYAGIIDNDTTVPDYYFVNASQKNIAKHKALYPLKSKVVWLTSNKLILPTDVDKTKVLMRPMRLLEFLSVFDSTQAKSLVRADFQLELDGLSKLINYDFKQLRILVVDDNDINLEVAKGVLEHVNAVVETVKSGEEAIALLQDPSHASIALMLLDINMGGIDGYETCKYIRYEKSVAHYQNLPIIAMTANAMSGEREKCIQAQMNDYVPKPFSPELLYQKIIKHVPELTAMATEKLNGEELQKADATKANDKQEDIKILNQINKNISSTNAQEGGVLQTSNEAVGPIEGKKIAAKTLQQSSLIDYENVLNNVNNDEKVVKIIYQLFFDSAQEDVNKFFKALDDHDVKVVMQLSHLLKGLTGNIGALSLSKEFSSIEQKYKTEAFNCENEKSAIKLMFPQVMKELNAYLSA